MSKSLAVAAVVALASGCGYGNRAFPCDNDSQCGAGGTCELSFHLCSLPDSTCPSGHRYNDQSGAQSGRCVGQEQQQIDAGTEPLPPMEAFDAPPDAQACFGTDIVRVCFASAPDQPRSLDQTLDTDDPASCAANVISGGNGYCVVGATTIAVTGTLRATGSKPLVLIASESITVSGEGLIDASSRRLRAASVPEKGAGADPAICVPGNPATSTGGGPGGSFTGKGGLGGAGDGTNTGTVADAATLPITALRGGCPGQDGQKTPGSGGHGGGAVYLIAGVRIDVGANGITAGGEAGAGGTAGPDGGGGGGGGAGGMIGFDAPVIVATVPVVANGGAGGEGGKADSAVAGGDGEDAGTKVTAASGGTGSPTGGNGGNGSAGAAAGPGAPGGNGGMNMGHTGGGGGGGGGAGLVKAPNTADFGNKAKVSPLPTP